jgi:hypothetical protein
MSGRQTKPKILAFRLFSGLATRLSVQFFPFRGVTPIMSPKGTLSLTRTAKLYNCVKRGGFVSERLGGRHVAANEGRPRYGWDSPVKRPDGVTHAERYLKRLGDRSFLSLWCHSGIYRDQGKTGPSGHGKEVADLFVVFENHVIIFSDKDCKYPNSGQPLLDWSRWYRRAVEAGANQVYGAEKWIRRHPNTTALGRIPFATRQLGEFDA